MAESISSVLGSLWRSSPASSSAPAATREHRGSFAVRGGRCPSACVTLTTAFNLFEQQTFHQACENGDIDAVKTFLKKHVVLNARDKNGWTPLHCAANCVADDVSA